MHLVSKESLNIYLENKFLVLIDETTSRTAFLTDNVSHRRFARMRIIGVSSDVVIARTYCIYHHSFVAIYPNI